MKLNVIKQRSLWWAISGAVILAGIAAMALSWNQFGAPVKPGLDFIGGTRLQLERDCTASETACDEPISTGVVSQVLVDQGIENGSVQLLGQNQQAIAVRTPDLDVDQRTALQSALEDALGRLDPQATQIDTVGPIIGEQLFTAGMLALIVAFAGITIYLSLRFQFDYALFALVALFHDALITLGIFSILGLAIGNEVDSLFIVALLTIVGFSVNDTVVIYDRIRETIKFNPQRHINDIVDDAVNQTLTRSLNTTLTTVLTLVAIFLFGGITLKYFSLALIVGFLSGAYSSIFVASTLLAWWRVKSGRAIAPVAPTSPSTAPSDNTVDI
ncbi:MAG: protein translocase subunit SecF [Cyanobacteria bacterium P01_H01_bin.119]